MHQIPCEELSTAAPLSFVLDPNKTEFSWYQGCYIWHCKSMTINCFAFISFPMINGRVLQTCDQYLWKSSLKSFIHDNQAPQPVLSIQTSFLSFRINKPHLYPEEIICYHSHALRLYSSGASILHPLI